MKIAVIDSGVDSNYYSHNDYITDCYGYEIESMEIIRVDDGFDSNGHGTQSIDTIHSVAPNAKIIAIRILDDKGMTNLEVLLRALKDLINADVDLINLSISVSDKSCPELDNLCKKLSDNGKIIVASVSNGSYKSIPAEFASVVGVNGMMFTQPYFYSAFPNDAIEMICDCSPIIVCDLNDQKSFYASNSKATCLATAFICNVMEKYNINKKEIVLQKLYESCNQKHISFKLTNEVMPLRSQKEINSIVNILKVQKAEDYCCKYFSCSKKELYSKRFIELGYFDADFILKVCEIISLENNLKSSNQIKYYRDFEWFECLINYMYTNERKSINDIQIQ